MTMKSTRHLDFKKQQDKLCVMQISMYRKGERVSQSGHMPIKGSMISSASHLQIDYSVAYRSLT